LLSRRPVTIHSSSQKANSSTSACTFSCRLFDCRHISQQSRPISRHPVMSSPEDSPVSPKASVLPHEKHLAVEGIPRSRCARLLRQPRPRRCPWPCLRCRLLASPAWWCFCAPPGLSRFGPLGARFPSGSSCVSLLGARTVIF
jgi:hypothetical protein